MEPPASVRAIMTQGIDQGVFPGGQLAVHWTRGHYRLAVGCTALGGLPVCQPVRHETRFDIASLTKILCTSVLLMQAVDQWGERLLEQSLDGFFSRPDAWRSATLHDLAAHRSGLPAHRPYFETIWARRIADPQAARQLIERRLRTEPFQAEPGQTTVYSDLGYILLGWILESLFEESLKSLFEKRIACPLGLESTRFGPVESPAAATEKDEQGRWLVGRVHDENARVLGGIAGHAGLFSTATEVVRIVRHLAEIHRGASGIVRQETVRTFWKPMSGSSFTLGWDTPTEPSSSGRHTTRGASVGHLGFTGCSLWHDYSRDVTIGLLTNRVHPTRENWGIRAFRPLLHDLVNQSLPP